MKYLIKILIIIIIINVLLFVNKCLVKAQCSTDCQTVGNIKPVIKYLTNTLNSEHPPVECSLKCPPSINCNQFINTTLAVYTFNYNYYSISDFTYGGYAKTNQISSYYDSTSNSIKAEANLNIIFTFSNVTCKFQINDSNNGKNSNSSDLLDASGLFASLKNFIFIKSIIHTQFNLSEVLCE
jgi:hypothetical protein